MPDDNRNPDEDRQRKNGGEFRMPPRGWMAWILIMCLAGLFFILKSQYEPQGEEISQAKFKELYNSNLIANATVKFGVPTQTANDVVGDYFVVTDGKKEMLNG